MFPPIITNSRVLTVIRDRAGVSGIKSCFYLSMEGRHPFGRVEELPYSAMRLCTSEAVLRGGTADTGTWCQVQLHSHIATLALGHIVLIPGIYYLRRIELNLRRTSQNLPGQVGPDARSKMNGAVNWELVSHTSGGLPIPGGVGYSWD